MSKTERIITWSVVAASLIMSIAALCRSLPCVVGVDYMGVIVGILSLLVTMLVGWQLINYFIVEKRMKNYTEKLVGQYSHSVNCYAIALTATTAYERNMTEVGIDTSITAIKEGLDGYDGAALDLPMSQLANLAKACRRGSYDAIIYKGKRTEYIKTVALTNDDESDIVIDMLMSAKEI